MPRSFSILILILTSCPTAWCQVTPTTIDFDFEDGIIPAELLPGPGDNSSDGRQTIEDGSYIIHPEANRQATSFAYFDQDDIVIESQVRFLSENESRQDYLGIFGRGRVVDGEIVGGAYGGSINTDGQISLGRYVDRVSFVTADGFDAVSQDLKLRLVLDGPQIELYAWGADESIPTTPQLVFTDDDPVLTSDWLGIGNTSFDPTGPAAKGAFRYLTVETVPEPQSSCLVFLGLLGTMILRHRPPQRSN